MFVPCTLVLNASDSDEFTFTEGQMRKAEIRANQIANFFIQSVT